MCTSILPHQLIYLHLIGNAILSHLQQNPMETVKCFDALIGEYLHHDSLKLTITMFCMNPED
jgi:hypothetical protein